MKNWKLWAYRLVAGLISGLVGVFMMNAGAGWGTILFCMVASALILALIAPGELPWRRSSWDWEDPHG